MGDPKKLKKKYSGPAHPWNENAIAEEKILIKEYGLVKKKEIYIASSKLKKYKNIAKRLIADKTGQGQKEKGLMMNKLFRLSLLPAQAALDNVLSLELKDILERRLQSIVFRKGLAKSMKQARQFIIHRHIQVSGKEITSPSYLVSREEENALAFKANSALSSETHPERTILAKEKEVKAENEEKVKTEERKGEIKIKKEETAKVEKKPRGPKSPKKEGKEESSKGKE